ncbi:MAG: hypothetical protein JSU96_19645 [Acidobacteriota bacterium]|nr:MAG: hypothetical protein JSU96_19645 [Acidobacteriota bacterium]
MLKTVGMANNNLTLDRLFEQHQAARTGIQPQTKSFPCDVHRQGNKGEFGVETETVLKRSGTPEGADPYDRQKRHTQVVIPRGNRYRPSIGQPA